MTHKIAEKRVRDLTNHYVWYKHKYGDVRYCIHCHQPLPKSENAPDFYIAQVGQWVEAKNSDASGTWNCSELYEDGTRANQRKFLIENNGWLFIELSDDTEKTKGAFLIPFAVYISYIEPNLKQADMKSVRLKTVVNKDGSVRRLGADRLFSGYALEWKKGAGWIIPKGHVWWESLRNKLLEQVKFIEDMPESIAPYKEETLW